MCPLTSGVVIEGASLFLCAVASKEGFVVVVLIPIEWLDLQTAPLGVATDNAGYGLVYLGRGPGYVHIGQKHYFLAHVTPAPHAEYLVSRNRKFRIRWLQKEIGGGGGGAVEVKKRKKHLELCSAQNPISEHSPDGTSCLLCTSSTCCRKWIFWCVNLQVNWRSQEMARRWWWTWRNKKAQPWSCEVPVKGLCFLWVLSLRGTGEIALGSCVCIQKTKKPNVATGMPPPF